MDIDILGAKGTIEDVDAFLARIERYAVDNKVQILAVNADMVLGKGHVISAVRHAERAFNAGKNTAKTLTMEALLYLSGERQISVAIEKMGVRKGEANIALVLFNETAPAKDLNAVAVLDLRRDDSVLEPSVEKARRFGISESEIELYRERLEDMALEKVAFVELTK